MSGISRLVPAVIIFGETAAGKSSLIDMLDGDLKASSNNGALGGSFYSTSYERKIRGVSFRIFDTAGLNEGSKVKASKALKSLRNLVDQLDGGVNLLVYVMRQPRIKSTTPKNYSFFYVGICQKKVPIVIVITGLEERAERDGWWAENEAEFGKNGMYFGDFACITATRGKRYRDGTYVYGDEYQQSKEKVEELIWNAHKRESWKMPQSWTTSIADAIRSTWTTVLGFETEEVSSALQAMLQDQGEPSLQEPKPNRVLPSVVVFGETGAGKSSVVNMLDGDPLALSGDAAVGETLGSICYKRTIRGFSFRVFDTAGLNEASKGTVTASEALKNLCKLARQLDEGVNLLVYVMRQPRIKSMAPKNYSFFYAGICQKKVPIVIVITGLEERENMDGWWVENEANFEQNGMNFDGSACVTATKGKRYKDGTYTYADEYQQSKEKVAELIWNAHKREAWKIPQSWTTSIADAIRSTWTTILGFETEQVNSVLQKVLQDQGESSLQEPKPNRVLPSVIVFGETGAGKSSVVNMLDGDTMAETSDQAIGVTFTSQPYVKIIFGAKYRVFDTVGLNEGTQGRVAARDAIEGLYRLMRKLGDGLNLLVYVMRAPRIPSLFEGNYKLFHDIFCDKQVRIVIIVTGLEDRNDMDQWWDENKKHFEDRSMSFYAFACITGTRGKLIRGNYTYEELHEESKVKVEKLIGASCQPNPWKIPTKSWFESTIPKLLNLLATVFGLAPPHVAQELYDALKQYAGYSDEEAKVEADKIESRVAKMPA